MKKVKINTKTGPQMIVSSALCGAIICVILTYSALSFFTEDLIPIGIVLVIVGIIVQSKTFVQKWSDIGMAVFFASLFSWIPSSDINMVISISPYLFILFFCSFVIYNKAPITKIDKNTTLFMSVSIVYWLISHGFYNIFTGYVFLIAGICILNTFIKIPLAKPMQLLLSMWTSVIVVLFACDNAYNIYQIGKIENLSSFIDKLLVGSQYFVLGLSSIYVIQNVFMLLGFVSLPKKGYFQDLKILVNNHINRYSNKQVDGDQASIILILSIIFFATNYFFGVLSEITVIWLAFFSIHFVKSFYD